MTDEYVMESVVSMCKSKKRCLIDHFDGVSYCAFYNRYNNECVFVEAGFEYPADWEVTVHDEV